MRNKKYSRKEKKKVIAEIKKGISPQELLILYPNIPESTIYDWSSKDKIHKTRFGKYTVREVNELKMRLEKVTRQVDAIKSSPFFQNTTKTERMIEMRRILNEDRDGIYTKAGLCKAFDIDRATFYHFLNSDKRENGKNKN